MNGVAFGKDATTLDFLYIRYPWLKDRMNEDQRQIKLLGDMIHGYQKKLAESAVIIQELEHKLKCN